MDLKEALQRQAHTLMLIPQEMKDKDKHMKDVAGNVRLGYQKAQNKAGRIKARATFIITYEKMREDKKGIDIHVGAGEQLFKLSTYGYSGSVKGLHYQHIGEQLSGVHYSLMAHNQKAIKGSEGAESTTIEVANVEGGG